MSILDVLTPKEVKASLLALDIEIEAADTLMLSMAFELAAPAVRNAIRNSPDKVRSKIHAEHMSPKTIVYLMLVNHIGVLMDSHQYHSAFGGLLMQGDALVALWHRGAAELVRAGVWSQEAALEYRETRDRQINPAAGLEGLAGVSQFRVRTRPRPRTLQVMLILLRYAPPRGGDGSEFTGKYSS